MLRPKEPRGRLFVVATPLGRAEDISLRAAKTLLAARWIACEDTRVTRRLVARLRAPDLFGAADEVVQKWISVREENEARGADEVIRLLAAGTDVAYCSDAGAPGVSDPGRVLVEKVRAAGFEVVALPGPSAVTAALALSGMPASSFTFAGFLPAKSAARRAALERIRDREETIVLFEAPHRMQELMHDVAELCGPRPVVICRELTKEHEEVIRTTTAVAAERDDWRGEITIVMEGAPPREDAVGENELTEFLRDALARGVTARDAVDDAVKTLGVSKREAYKLVLAMKEAK